MAKKYSDFIELAPGYESVVDINADNKQADFWSRYIVNEDMVNALDLLSRALRPDDTSEDVWHFWIKGSYGTGKTYSAIVLKHLLEDDYDVVENFIKKNKLFLDVKDRFLSVRKKGKYYVKFRSGECKQLNTANKLLFQLEQSVRDVLKENDFSYTGRNSLITSVQKKVDDFKPTLENHFANSEFPQYWGTYDSFDAFYSDVQAGDIEACSNAQEIFEELDVGLATDLETFKNWLWDLYEGNPELKKTGIFIIWDEFTEYIRANDMDIIQQLSLFSKELPFFIIYVIHEYPGLFKDDVTATANKAEARFHKIDITLNEKTTLKLIGESIITKDGMKDAWAETCENLAGSLEEHVDAFVGDPGEDIDISDLKDIFPIHPMTVNLVSKVAGLAASNRSIFEFLKSSGDDGFRSYIQNNGEYEWKWVTIDYLWDYFFVNNQGGKKTLSKMAEDALKHYDKVKNQINDEKMLRVFKGAMLLLATVGSGQSMRKRKTIKGPAATEATLCECFCGVLNDDIVKQYLQTLSSDPLNMLTLAKDNKVGARIELPYYSTNSELESEIAKLKQTYKVKDLLEGKGVIGSELRTHFLPKEKAVTKRLVVDTCYGSTQQIKFKFSELEKEINKTNYKFGMLVVAGIQKDEIEKAKEIAKQCAESSPNERMLICVLKLPLSTEDLEEWYDCKANAILSQHAGSPANAQANESQAAQIISSWISRAVAKDMYLIIGGSVSTAYTDKAVLSKYENRVFTLFPEAPENFIKKNTLYKPASLTSAYFGVSRTTNETKGTSEKAKGFNQLWQDCVDVLKGETENVWDCESIDEVIALQETKVGKSMSKLCSYLKTELTADTVDLDTLWDGLQKNGYYNTGICSYLLGFAFRFFIGKYTWYDGNNSHKLDEDNIPQMIMAMVTDKSGGMRIASESNLERRFREFSKKVFKLSDAQAGDVFQCQKNIKVLISKMGAPLWSAKYLDDKVYLGLREEVSLVTDGYMKYILEEGNLTECINDIIGIIKEKPKQYENLLGDIYTNKKMLKEGILNYAFEVAPQIKETLEQYNFSTSIVFDMLSNLLAEETWQWKEDAVERAANKLVLDMTLVGLINSALDSRSETVDKAKEILLTNLDYIHVPGCVLKKYTAPWRKTVEVLHDIAVGKWSSYSLEEKESIISDLEKHIEDAIDIIKNPLDVLRWYISDNSLGTFSLEECESILQKMRREPYGQTEAAFKANLREVISQLENTKTIESIMTVWANQTGTSSLTEWTVKNTMPIAWVLPNYSNEFSILKSIESKQHVPTDDLKALFETIQTADLSALCDQAYIKNRFVENVLSDQYKDLLSDHVGDIKSVIQKAGFYDYSSWANNIVDIRKIVNNYIKSDLRAEVSDKAKDVLSKLTSIDEVKQLFDKVLDQSPEACLLILGD